MPQPERSSRHQSLPRDYEYQGKSRQPRRDSYMRSYSPGGGVYPAPDSGAPQIGKDGASQAPSQQRGSATPSTASLQASQGQLAPYDDEKAYAEYTRVYGPEFPPPSPSEAETRLPIRNTRRVRSPSVIEDDRVTYDSRTRHRDDMTDYTRHTLPDDDGKHRHRRRYSLRAERDKSSKEPENKLTSSLIGGASGAYLGNRLFGKGALGTLGGAVVGALGVKAIDFLDGKRQSKSKSRPPRRRRTDDLRSSSPVRNGYYSHDEYDRDFTSTYSSRSSRALTYAERPRRVRRRRSYSTSRY